MTILMMTMRLECKVRCLGEAGFPSLPSDGRGHEGERSEMRDEGRSSRPLKSSGQSSVWPLGAHTHTHTQTGVALMKFTVIESV